MRDNDYYKRLDDITFELNIKSYYIVSNRGKFPVLDSRGNVIQGNLSVFDKEARFDNQGMRLSGHPNLGYVKDYQIDGTAWLVDYLLGKPTDDFYEFIAAANIHVASLADLFMIL